MKPLIRTTYEDLIQSLETARIRSQWFRPEPKRDVLPTRQQAEEDARQANREWLERLGVR